MKRTTKRFLSVMAAVMAALILLTSPLHTIVAMADAEPAPQAAEEIIVNDDEVLNDAVINNDEAIENEIVEDEIFESEPVNDEPLNENEVNDFSEAESTAEDVLPESDLGTSAPAGNEIINETTEIPVEPANAVDINQEKCDTGTVPLSHSDEAPLTEEATTYTSGYWEYEVTNGGAKLKKYTGSQSSVTIPDKIGGYTVTTIGNSCMSGNAAVQTLTIPENIVSIEYGAFKNCYSLSRINFNARNCNAGGDVFLNAGASAYSLDVVFGYGVTKIPAELFKGSEEYFARVSSVTISDTVRTIEHHAFQHCHNLKTIQWGSKVDTIDYHAFANCYALKQLILPASVSKIGYNAFENCRDMVTLTIPAGLTDLGNYAFCGCISLSRINFNAKNTACGGSVFMNTGASADKLELIFGSGVITVPTGLMSSYSSTGYSRVSSVKFSDTITTIKKEAFKNCQELRSITWGSGIVTIEQEAFRNCTSLTELTLPGKVAKIGNTSFNGCTSLKSVTIPAAVTTIDYGAFENCTDLTKITIYSKNTTYGVNVFGNCSPNLIIYCYKDSTLPAYADKKGHKYKYLAGAGTFSDVTNPNAAYYVPVYWGTEKGIVTGYSDGTFRPNNPCTRGQVVMFLWRAAGKPAPKSGTVKFTDVKSSHPYYKAILWASQKGIAAGYSNGTFKPDATCTRGQIVTFLWRYAGKPSPKAGAPTFPDVPKSHPYYTAIRWAAGRGITTGFSNGTFRPDQKCTRGQCITFIYRLMH